MKQNIFESKQCSSTNKEGIGTTVSSVEGSVPLPVVRKFA